MADVFISHSSKDKETADKVVAFLEERGISCWIAPRNIVAGSDWAASISAAINSTKIFLLIYSENSAASEQVAREMNLAETVDGVFVVPYKIDETPLTGTYQYYLTGAHWIIADVRKNDYKLDELHLMISGINEGDTQSIANNTNIYREGNPAVTTAAAGSKKKFIIAGIAGAVALAGVAAVMIILFSGNNKPVPVQTTDSPSETTDVTTEDKITCGTITDYNLVFETNVIKGTYTGDIGADGLPQGTGEFNGIYTVLGNEMNFKANGSFSNGQMNGHAVVEISSEGGNREIHECDSFVNGKEDGLKKYTVYCTDGSTLKTEVAFKNGLATGHGMTVVTYLNGDTETLEGEYIDGALNGEGTYVYNYVEGSSDLGVKISTYTGQFKENVPSGEGKLVTEYYSGIKSVYVGRLADGQTEGKGTCTVTYPESEETRAKKIDIYTGYYKAGLENGQGTRTTDYYNGDREYYEGEFANGIFNGHGTSIDTYASEDSMNGLKIDKYIGEFKNGRMNGKGKRITEFFNGDTETLDGDWVNDYVEGNVNFEHLFADPEKNNNIAIEKFSGSVKNDKRNGAAISTFIYIDSTSIVITGEWADNDVVDGSTVVKLDEDGNIIKSGVIKDGIFEWK